MEKIRDRIRIKRLEKKYSQEYMALRLNISQGYYNKMENGVKEMPLTVFIKIVEVLEMDLNDLIY